MARSGTLRQRRAAYLRRLSVRPASLTYHAHGHTQNITRDRRCAWSSSARQRDEMGTADWPGPYAPTAQERYLRRASHHCAPCVRLLMVRVPVARQRRQDEVRGRVAHAEIAHARRGVRNAPVHGGVLCRASARGAHCRAGILTYMRSRQYGGY